MDFARRSGIYRVTLCPTPGKKRYASRRKAKMMARQILSAHNRRLYVYRCECEAFHLSSHKHNVPRAQRLGEKVTNLLRGEK